MANGMSGGPLVAPERNNYFYGKLMDVAQFNKEQSYVNQKRWLLNRLLCGSGIVCGLGLDVESNDRLRIMPGVALDAVGHEIILPNPVSINPRQLTDEQGHPVGDPLDQGEVDICLAYAEKRTDLVPVLVADCDAPGHCAAGTLREGFHVIVRMSTKASTHGCELGEFPLPADDALHELLCKQINANGPATPADTCVVLAHVKLRTPGLSPLINPSRNRQLVYSNPLLQQLIVCLSERVDRLVRVLYLRYFSGDGQTAPSNQPLKQTLVVELRDAEGKPVENRPVTFEVTAGGGDFNGPKTITVTTNIKGMAEAKWTLGLPGDQHATARATGSPFTVNFHATSVT
jgi:hypothetical protein